MLGEKRIVNTSYDEPVKLDELKVIFAFFFVKMVIDRMQGLI